MDVTTTEQASQRWRVLAAGVLSMVLMQGIARFAYTPLLPLMQQQAGMGVAEGGWLASANYFGYLCGALLASVIGDLRVKDTLYRLSLVLAVLTTLLMGLAADGWLWGISRFIAGLSTAGGMLLGSGLVLNWLMRNNHRSELGIHFSGIGIGIVLCSLAVVFLTPSFDWREQWFLFTAAGALLAVPAWRWLPRPATTPVTSHAQSMADNPPRPAVLRVFMAAYFCAGIGYVVSATFIVAIVDHLPGMRGKGAWVFMVLGLAAAPACILWDFIARRVGQFNALVLASGSQIVGILMPVMADGLPAALLGAALFGGTFIGLVSLVLAMAGRYYPTKPAKMMGKMTVAYGIAQIAGPAVTGWLAANGGSYADGLYMAAGMMVLGTALLWWMRNMEMRPAPALRVVRDSA